jgi:hypothetical protein
LRQVRSVTVAMMKKNAQTNAVTLVYSVRKIDSVIVLPAAVLEKLMHSAG